MSSVDKIKLDASTSTNIPETIMYRSGTGTTQLGELQIMATGGSQGDILLYDNSNTNRVRLFATGSGLTNWDLIFPGTPGATGQTMITSTYGGNMVWSSISTYVDPLTSTGDMLLRTNVTSRLPLTSTGASPTGATLQGLYLKVDSNSLLPNWGRQYDPRTISVLFDDFRGVATPFGDYAWLSSVNGAGAALTQVSSSGMSIYGYINGLIQLSAGTANTGRCAVYRTLTQPGIASNNVIDIEMVISPQQLSDANGTYILLVGCGDIATTNADHNNGFYFVYDSSVSTYWQARSAAGGTRTSVISSVVGFPVVSAGYYYRLRILATNSEIKYYIQSRDSNGAIVTGEMLVAIITTNLPIANTNVFGPVFKIYKTTGAQARYCYVDYWYSNRIFTADR